MPPEVPTTADGPDDRSPEPPPPVENPRRALATVLAVVFVDLLGFGVIIPILPFYVRSFGTSDVFIGLLAATYSLAQFGSAPLLGRLSDERGRRPVLLVSVAGSVVAWTLFGVGGSLAVLFLARGLAGAMGGNIATAQAYIADVTPPERRAGALGLVGAAFGLGFIFGPALGGLFASPPVLAVARDVLPGFVPVTAFSLPSFAAAGLSLLALLLTAGFLPESRPTGSTGSEPGTVPRSDPASVRESELAAAAGRAPVPPVGTGPMGTRGLPSRRRSWVGQFRTALADPGLRGLVVSFFLVSVAFSGVQVMFIPFVADAYGFDESGAALLLTYVGVWGVLVQGVLVGRLSRRFTEGPVAVAGTAVLGVALVALPFSPAVGSALGVELAGPPFLTAPLAVLLGVLPLLAVGNGLLSVTLTTLVSTRADSETQGSAFGVTQGAGSLGRTVGPPAMAALYVLARPAPFLAGALLVVPVLAILLRDWVGTRG